MILLKILMLGKLISSKESHLESTIIKFLEILYKKANVNSYGYFDDNKEETTYYVKFITLYEDKEGYGCFLRGSGYKIFIEI